MSRSATALALASAGQARSGRLLVMASVSTEDGLVRRVFVDHVQRLVASCVPTDPPHWRAPGGGCPWELLDFERANAALAAGASVTGAARVIAARALGRRHGRTFVRKALRGLEAF